MKDDLSTRERILRAATDVFGEYGYRAATVRDICGRAGVGVASINYHFGDKEKLYLAVYRHLLSGAITEYPPDLDLGPDPDPEERLYAFVRSFLLRMSDFGGRNSLILREMLDPSPELAQLHLELVSPLKETLVDIVRVLLGNSSRDHVVEHTAQSIIGQCLFYGPQTSPVRTAIWDHEPDTDVTLLARHITDFSLGGIHALKTRED